REQERAGRVGVEPPDRDEASRVVGDELDDRRPTLRVARGRDGSYGLIEQHVRERLPFERPPVQLDAVAFRHERVELPGLPVDGNAAGLDQLVGLPPRGDPGAGEVRVEPHASIFTEGLTPEGSVPITVVGTRTLRVPVPAIIRHVPHYVSLMRWTSQGVAGLPAWRERVEDGERTITEAGGKLVGVYVTLGRYDVVEIFEAPDDDTAPEIILKPPPHAADHT